MGRFGVSGSGGLAAMVATADHGTSTATAGIQDERIEHTMIRCWSTSLPLLSWPSSPGWPSIRFRGWNKTI